MDFEEETEGLWTGFVKLTKLINKYRYYFMLVHLFSYRLQKTSKGYVNKGQLH